MNVGSTDKQAVKERLETDARSTEAWRKETKGHRMRKLQTGRDGEHEGLGTPPPTATLPLTSCPAFQHTAWTFSNKGI